MKNTDKNDDDDDSESKEVYKLSGSKSVAQIDTTKLSSLLEKTVAELVDIRVKYEDELKATQDLEEAFDAEREAMEKDLEDKEK